MNESVIFKDRMDAAEQLAAGLQEYQGRNPLILAIPRGAVPMGKVLAERLHGELDIVLAHKLASPFNPEFAIGAIDETGWVYLSSTGEEDEDTIAMTETIRERQLAELRQRRILYAPFMRPIDPQGRIAIVVDDGLATGATMIAALHAVRARQPAELICAIPVAASDSLEKITPLVDKVVCLHETWQFGAISQFYAQFSQVDDEEVRQILAAGSGATVPTSLPNG
ncbi:phosphoribosyltransferase [Herminiimonas sp. NPDC097707]|uniref:phosphoribosyltransferase n=1 Tax=Herminiimonas sp. NPDC097707 TaxID=3364007 RepID=UPI00383B9E31